MLISQPFWWAAVQSAFTDEELLRPQKHKAQQSGALEYMADVPAAPSVFSACSCYDFYILLVDCFSYTSKN